MQHLEILAVILGLACVWLTARQHIGCWPAGLAMVSLYLVIFFEAKLYSDMLLQGIYIVLQIYGWYAWLHGGDRGGRLDVSRLPRSQIWTWLAVCAGGTAALGGLMSGYTDAALPYVDAFTTAASLIAQWLMGRKVLESWLVWIVVDIVSVHVYLVRDLHLTAGLYLVFLVLAAWGWWQWRQSWQNVAVA